MQLQIANNDGCSVGLVSPRQKAHKAVLREEAQVAVERQKRRSSAIRTMQADQSMAIASRRETVKSSIAPQTAWKVSSRQLFFRENIMPLTRFMDVNSAESPEAVNQVKIFLVLFLTEQSMSNVVVLLRSIKNRKDSWGRDSFGLILRYVHEHIRETHKVQIDTDYLRLT